jgi:hypothetical protein
MAKGIRISVQSYSGYKANERPSRFSIGENEYEVREIIDRWYGPDYSYFKVRADDGHIYILRYDERGDIWELEFFQ